MGMPGRGERPGCRCGRFVEIVNLLFIRSQWDQETQRLAPLVRLVQSYCPSPNTPPPWWGGLRGGKSEWVIADHIRALVFFDGRWSAAARP